MEPIKDMRINRLPVRTWNRLNMNESVLEEDEAERLKSAEREKNINILSGKMEKKESVARLLCKAGENKACEAVLTAEEGSCLTVWMEISSPKEAEGLFSLSTRIKAEKNAKVRLIQTQLLGSGYLFMNDIKTDCEEGARVELLQLFLGGTKTWAGFLGNLDGTESSILAELGYWCRNTQQLDMNYVTYHTQKNTESHILARGVLADKAFKLFRGTIDFKQGASGSEGEETEEVLMLGDEAVNQTIPLILCGEEDVCGNHGATIGEPDEEVLFYLSSRGIGKDEAVKLLARAKIEGLCVQIGNEELEEKVQKYLEEVIVNG